MGYPDKFVSAGVARMANSTSAEEVWSRDRESTFSIGCWRSMITFTCRLNVKKYVLSQNESFRRAILEVP